MRNQDKRCQSTDSRPPTNRSTSSIGQEHKNRAAGETESQLLHTRIKHRMRVQKVRRTSNLGTDGLVAGQRTSMKNESSTEEHEAMFLSTEEPEVRPNKAAVFPTTHTHHEHKNWNLSKMKSNRQFENTIRVSEI
jgi:hypothetical protein